MNTLLLGIKILAVCSFLSPQSTSVQTDRQTDGRTDRQNYDPQDRAGIAASRGKNRRTRSVKNIRNTTVANETVTNVSDSILLCLFILYSHCSYAITVCIAGEP